MVPASVPATHDQAKHGFSLQEVSSLMGKRVFKEEIQMKLASCRELQGWAGKEPYLVSRCLSWDLSSQEGQETRENTGSSRWLQPGCEKRDASGGAMKLTGWAGVGVGRLRRLGSAQSGRGSKEGDGVIQSSILSRLERSQMKSFKEADPSVCADRQICLQENRMTLNEQK